MSQYVGKTLQEIPIPAAVLDISSVKRNCQGMLRLKSEGNYAVNFLPLIETHKVRCYKHSSYSVRSLASWMIRF